MTDVFKATGDAAGKNTANAVHDLRSAIELLQQHPGQYYETDHPVNPIAELAGVYKRIGAGGTVPRPTRLGPAMMFNNVAGYPGWRVLVGVLASRERVGLLLDCSPRELTRRMTAALNNPIAPVEVGPEKAVCQEVVHRADDPDFDLRTLLPAPTNTPIDAGPYFCLGLLLGSDPVDGTDVTIHRMCVQGKDELSIFFAPGRHIDAFRAKAEAQGKPLSVSVNMGLDPAIFVSSSFEAPSTPYGFDELGVAGAIRGRGIELAKCLTVDQRCIAAAEVVIEGEILPNVRVREDQNSNTGRAMPEFPGYVGPANQSLPVLKVKAVTHRGNPILQTLVGPGEEHTILAGIPTEASIYNLCQRAVPGFISAVYAHTAGGGKFLVIMQCNKKNAFDDGRARYAALVALAAYPELKNVILVDEDVDIFDSDDVLWAMQTRMQGDLDIINIPGVSGHVLDPSQHPRYNPRLPAVGVTTKTIFDCTGPFHLRDELVRAPFLDVDPRPFAPDLFSGKD